MAYEGRVHESTLKRRFYERVEPDPNSGCWLWFGGVDENGYGRVKAPVKTRSHRMAYIWNVGPIPDGMVIMHKCDTPACVNHNHLRLGTNLDNIADRHAKGRTTHDCGNPGEAHPNAKLKESDVIEIRRRVANGERRAVIAQDYKVSLTRISKIMTGKSWSHIKEN